jgi:type IV pilus assembly protein PilM
MLSGGGADMPGIREAFAELTRLPVVEADPFGHVAVARSIASDGLRTARSKAPVAIGLAVGSVA